MLSAYDALVNDMAVDKEWCRYSDGRGGSAGG